MLTDVNDVIGVTGTWYHWWDIFAIKGVKFRITDEDIYRVESHLGFKIKCEDIAKQYNAILKEKLPCVRFSCEKGPSEKFGIQYIRPASNILEPFK